MDVHVLGAVCAVWIVQNYFFSPFCFYFVVSLCADYLCVYVYGKCTDTHAAAAGVRGMTNGVCVNVF